MSDPEKKSSRAVWTHWCVIPAATSSIATIATVLLYRELTTCGLNDKRVCPLAGVDFQLMERLPPIQAYLDRLTWGTAATASLLTSLIVIGICVGVIVRRLPSKNDRPSMSWMSATLIVSGVSLAAVAYMHLNDFSFGPYKWLGEHTVAKQDGVEPMLVLLNRLTFAAAACVFAASGAILVVPSQSPQRPEETERHAKSLSQSAETLQLILYCGAIELVLSVMAIRTLYAWAADFIVVETGYAFSPPGAIAGTVGTMVGALFSLVLAAAYLPAAVLLYSRARELASTAKPNAAESERTVWLESRGVSFTLPRLISRALAVLGPLIAGSLDSVLPRLIDS